MDRKPTETDRAREGGFTLLRLIVAGYLVYLGVSLLRSMTGGAMPPLPGGLFGVLFIAGGLLFAVFSWRRWRAVSAAQAEAKAEQSPDDGAEEP